MYQITEIDENIIILILFMIWIRKVIKTFKLYIKEMIKLANNLIVRSSSAEFLIFERQKGEKGLK